MKTRKLLSGISVLICCFCFCIPSLAANTDASSQSVVGIDTLGYVDSIDVTFSDLLSNSIITYADSEVMSGHYNGDSTVLWVEIGGVGTLTDFDLTQTIEFDWTAKVNSSGDYIFDKITNANSSMSPDLHLLYFDVESKELKDQYTISTDRKSVTFTSSYELSWRYYNETKVTTGIANLKRVIEMQDLI